MAYVPPRMLPRLFVENTPENKPELWRHLGGNLRRRAAAVLNGALDSSWWRRPFIATIEPEKLLLEVVPGDVIGKPIVYFGIYEYAVSALLRTFLEPGDTFVDVGANLGYYTVLAASLVTASGVVVAFEPSTRIRARLARNVALNQLVQVEVRPEAVARQAGVVHLVEPHTGNNDGLAFVDLSGQRGVGVPSIRLDELAALQRRMPTLLKVDVEGGEGEVFAGAERLLADENGPSILFESFDLAKDASFLQAHGYEIYQPVLRKGRVGLTSDLGAAPYRRWEAPNFLAVKSPRGRRTVGSLLAVS